MQHSKCCVRNVPRVRIPNSPPKREVMLWHCFSFFVWDSNKEGADLSAEENSPVDCFCRRGQGAKRREGIRQYAEKIPNSPPKREVMLWHCFSFFVWDSNKEGADLSAEENSPVDCFCRRGQGAKRREGIRQYAEKIPNSPPKREVMLWHCFSFFVWDSNKEGADLSAEENSPVDCFRRRGQGAKRREGIRHFFIPSVVKDDTST